MTSSVRQVFYLENVGQRSPESLAMYLASLSNSDWQKMEVVYLYGKLQSSHPLCAAVRMSNRQYAACKRRNVLGFLGNKFNILSREDCNKRKSSVRWIQFMDGSRISVKGTKHWAIDHAQYLPHCDDKEDEKKPEKEGRFYNWETIMGRGGDCFCYAAFDCGCMIQEKPKFETLEIDSLMEKLVETGVQRLILKGSSIKKAERAKDLASLYPDHLRFSVGYNLDVAGAWFPEKLSTLKNLASDPLCVAVGECSIDTKNCLVPLDKQLELMRMQMKLACQVKKPLLIFERDAQNHVLDLLKEFRDYMLPVAVRTRSANCDFNLYIDSGCYIIVTGWMFTKDTYNTPFYIWLRNAKPWQLDYLLLASNSGSPEDVPTFVDKVLFSEFKRVTLHVPQNFYTAKAMDLYSTMTKQRRCPSSPFHLPVLIELTADAASSTPAELSLKCVENSCRFFQVVKKQQQVREMKKSGWRDHVKEFVVTFVLSFTITLAVIWIVVMLYRSLYR